MLGRMFSSDLGFSLQRDVNGNVFIDRDGETFRHVLNYLRSGFLPSLSTESREALAHEADYFQIEPLVEALKITSKSTLPQECETKWLSVTGEQPEYDLWMSAILEHLQKAAGEGHCGLQLLMNPVITRRASTWNVFEAVLQYLRSCGFSVVPVENSNYYNVYWSQIIAHRTLTTMCPTLNLASLTDTTRSVKRPLLGRGTTLIRRL